VLCKAALGKCVDKAQPGVYFCPPVRSANSLSRLSLLGCCMGSIEITVSVLQAVDVIAPLA